MSLTNSNLGRKSYDQISKELSNFRACCSNGQNQGPLGESPSCIKGGLQCGKGKFQALSLVLQVLYQKHEP